MQLEIIVKGASKSLICLEMLATAEQPILKNDLKQL